MTLAKNYLVDIDGVLAGTESGMETIHVLSGVTRREHVARYPYQPTRIADSVADMSRRCSARTGSPSAGCSTCDHGSYATPPHVTPSPTGTASPVRCCGHDLPPVRPRGRRSGRIGLAATVRARRMTADWPAATTWAKAMYGS